MSFESDNSMPSIILCVFPNLEKILLLNSINDSKNIIALNSEIMFNEDFYDSIESKFSKEIRSGNFSILSPNGVPEKVENILRDETISRIMNSVRDELRYFEEMSFKKIAHLTGVSINTSLGRMRYALINLKKLAEKEYIDLQLK